MNGLDPFVKLNISAGFPPSDIDPSLLVFLKSKLDKKNSPHISYTAELPYIPNQVVLVGCGGTGSELLPKLLQYLISKNKTDDTFKIPEILLIDGDIVEEKNLARQRFSLADIGKNKAEALAERYSSVFNVPIGVYSSYINSASLAKLLGGRPLIIGAVDNNRARLAILGAFFTNSYGFWVDCGNETFHGQSILSTNFSCTGTNTAPFWDKVDMQYSNIAAPMLPHFFQHFPTEFFGIPKDPLEPAGVCAQHVVENPQTIQANSYAALTGFTLASQLFEKKIQTYKIQFDAKLGAATSTSLTPANLIHLEAMSRNSFKLIQEWFKDYLFLCSKEKAEIFEKEVFNPQLHDIYIIPNTNISWFSAFRHRELLR